MSGQWNPLRLTAGGPRSALVAGAMLALYAAGTLYVALHHEPWRDEADPWLVARDASVGTILGWTRYVGSPALWFLTLKPLIWLGLPYPSQQWLHLGIAWAAAALLLFRSPFSWITRIGLLACYYLAYEYAVIVRSYALTILLAFLIASWHGDRYSRPIRYALAVALLFNVNVHGGILAASFLLIYLVCGRGSHVPRLAVLIMVAGGVAAWLQLRTPPDTAIPGVIRWVRPEVIPLAVDTAFFPGPWLRTGGVVSGVLLIVIAAALRRRLDAILVLAVPAALLSILYMLVWFGGYRHSGLILLVTVLAIWIAGDVRHDALSATAAVLLNLSLVVSAAFTIQIASTDVTMAFSGSQEMGDFIRESGFDRYEIAAHNFQQSEAVLPWLPGKRFWYPALGRYGTHMMWNREEEIGLRMPHEIAAQRAAAHFAPRGEPWLLLLNAPLADPAPFELIYTNRIPIFRHHDERYWLYGYRPTR